MNCKRIEKELSAYLDDEVQGARRRQVEHHLSACHGCRVKLARLRRTAALVAAVPEVAAPADLAARVFSRVAPQGAPAMTCAEASDQVHAYADGWLTPAAIARLEEHLRDCPQCEAELRRVRAVKTAMANVPEVAPPPAVREAVGAAIAAREARSGRRLRPWVWGAIGTTAAAAAAWLVSLMGPAPAPDADRVAITPKPAPTVEVVPAPGRDDARTAERGGGAVAPATSLIGRITRHLRPGHEDRTPEPPPAAVEPTIGPEPTPSEDIDVVTTVDPNGAEDTSVTVTDTIPDTPPDAPVEVHTVAVVVPPDTPETDAWEAVGVRRGADETPYVEETMATASRGLFRFSPPVEHKEVVIRASGAKRRGGGFHGSDGGYVEVVAGSL